MSRVQSQCKICDLAASELTFKKLLYTRQDLNSKLPALYYLRGFDNSNTHRAALLHWADSRLEPGV